jgi:hypothetical protein
MKSDDGVGEFAADPFEDRDGMGRNAVVIPPQHGRVVGIGADYGDAAKIFTQREDIILITKEDDTFPCHFGSMFDVPGAFHEVGREGRVGDKAIGVEHTELEPGAEETPEGSVEGSPGDETLVKSNGKGAVTVTTLEVCSGTERVDGSADGIGMRVVASFSPEIVDSAAVGKQDTVILPFIAEDMGEELVIGTAWLPVEAVVGTHNFLNLAFGNESLEGREIGGMEIPRTDRHVELMAVPFRAAMYGIMFGAGMGFIVLGMIALQAFDHGKPHALCEKRVFTIGFHTASPSGVPEDVDIGRPKSQAFVPGMIVVT